MFEEFAGNKEIKETVKNAVKSGRFPHAFIIEGEEGSGRHTLARIIAAAAVCESEDAPCGKCRVCGLVRRDGHSDVLTYSPDGATFKVDTVREIRDKAYIMPIEAKRKVNILVDADRMNDSAQNALLKVLEEPPAFMVFILITANASALLPTVRSRCVTFSVQNPDTQEACEYIETVTDADRRDILEALECSHGNIGRALAVLKGDCSPARADAGKFLSCVASHDRYGALTVLFPYEKDRQGFSLFLGEFKFAVSEEIKRSLSGGTGTLTPTKLSGILDITDAAILKIREHVGQPLSIPVFCAAFCAEIFE